MSKIRAGILSQASGTPSFDPATYIASAIVDQDWTGLISTPAGWTVTSGTPAYVLGGLQTLTAVTLESDLSGLSLDDIPGTLLTIYEYNDYADLNFESHVADASEDYVLGHSGQGLTTDLELLMYRIEVPNSVDCEVGGAFTMFGPTSSRGYIASYTFPNPGFMTVMTGTIYTDNDIDVSLGPISGNDCDPNPGTGGFTAGSLDHIAVSITDATASNTTIVRTLYWDQYTTSAHIDELVTYLGYTP